MRVEGNCWTWLQDNGAVERWVGLAGVAGILVQIWGSVSGPAIYRNALIMRFIYTAVTMC